jgi:hypothetical protein
MKAFRMKDKKLLTHLEYDDDARNENGGIWS